MLLKINNTNTTQNNGLAIIIDAYQNHRQNSITVSEIILFEFVYRVLWISKPILILSQGKKPI